ncbi:hypothetical protein [Actinoplanes philippinensis]|uniref:hypothetical protein n=1 Tax=Actinoplanes philippinensis TaxID=35752 RepID=UPI0033DBC0C4
MALAGDVVDGEPGDAADGLGVEQQNYRAIDGELAQLDRDGYLPLRPAVTTAV